MFNQSYVMINSFISLTVLGNGGSSLLDRLLRYHDDSALQTDSGRSSKS